MRALPFSFAIQVAVASLFAASIASAAPKLGGGPDPTSHEQSSTPSADTKRAVDLFDQASEAYQEGRFAAAISLLRELRDIKPEPVLDYNLARAYEGLGRWREAIASYEAYLRQDVAIADRGAIERRLETLRGLDSAAVTESVSAQGSPPPKKADRSILLPSILGGTGLVSIGAGFWLGAASRGEESNADDGRDQRAAKDALDRAERLATFANVAFVAGAALVVAGAVWLFVTRSNWAGRGASTLRF